MSHKNSVHGLDVVSGSPTHSLNYRRLFLFALGVALVVALAVIVSNMRPTTDSVTAVSNENAIPYSDALAMQYAQPWLDAHERTTASVTYSDALAMQYAQPWLDAQERTAASVTYSNDLAMQYAQPWLDKQHTTDCNGRLDMMYACQNGYRPPEN